MALKMTISPSQYEGLPADVKKEYKASGSDYKLDLDGYEDPAELRRARDREKEEAAEAKRALAAEKAARTDAEKKARELEQAGKSVDDAVKAKETEWQTKFDKETGELKTKLDGLTNATISSHKASVADAIAAELSTVPKLLSNELQKRLEVEIDPNTNIPKLHILDGDGKRTSWTPEDLKKDVLKNKDYAPILRGTKASGGGGAPPATGGGGAPRQITNPGATAPDLSKMDPAELVQMISAQREAEGRSA